MTMLIASEPRKANSKTVQQWFDKYGESHQLARILAHHAWHGGGSKNTLNSNNQLQIVLAPKRGKKG